MVTPGSGGDRGEPVPEQGRPHSAERERERAASSGRWWSLDWYARAANVLFVWHSREKCFLIWSPRRCLIACPCPTRTREIWCVWFVARLRKQLGPSVGTTRFTRCRRRGTCWRMRAAVGERLAGGYINPWTLVRRPSAATLEQRRRHKSYRELEKDWRWTSCEKNSILQQQNSLRLKCCQHIFPVHVSGKVKLCVLVTGRWIRVCKGFEADWSWSTILVWVMLLGWSWSGEFQIALISKPHPPPAAALHPLTLSDKDLWTEWLHVISPAAVPPTTCMPISLSLIGETAEIDAACQECKRVKKQKCVVAAPLPSEDRVGRGEHASCFQSLPHARMGIMQPEGQVTTFTASCYVPQKSSSLRVNVLTDRKKLISGIGPGSCQHF